MYGLAHTCELLARKAGAEIRLHTEATPETVEAEQPDALIIAAGSRPLVPPIKGLDGDNVVIVNNYYREKDKVGDHVVVFGGGLAGCECAIHLGREGKKVEIVEMRPTLLLTPMCATGPCCWRKSPKPPRSIRDTREWK